MSQFSLHFPLFLFDCFILFCVCFVLWLKSLTLIPVFELRKNKMVAPWLCIQIVGCPYMAALEFHSLRVKIYGCPSDNCIRFLWLSGDLFGCPGPTDNRNFERCLIQSRLVSLITFMSWKINKETNNNKSKQTYKENKTITNKH